MRTRPEGRKSFSYRLYCDLVVSLKLLHSKKKAFAWVSEDREIPHWKVQRVYNRFVKPQLASGVLIRDLY